MDNNRGYLLVAEDIPDILNLLEATLKFKGYRVVTARNGEEALAEIQKEQPALIVADILMPRMDGFSMVHRLRINPDTRHIPVIFLTQKDERSDKLQGLELGADDYITKPFDIEELKLRVQGAIRRSERESLTDPRSGLPAGRLIEAAGLKLEAAGGIAVSDKHANYSVNEGQGTSADFVQLMQRVQARVRERFGVELHPEVKMWGFV